MRLLLLARHGQSLFNVDGTVNGDPVRDRGLSPLGEREAASLAGQLAGHAIDVCVVSEFKRAQQTAAAALSGREVPQAVDPELNDIRIGELEGKTLDQYHQWKHGRTRDEPFPAGESLNDAARRYAGAYERILRRQDPTILVVCHEIPVRYAINAAAGSDQLDGPQHDVANATPYVFDEAGLRRAIDRIRQLAG
jgi:broad specificity phosphatase PhoE